MKSQVMFFVLLLLSVGCGQTSPAPVSGTINNSDAPTQNVPPPSGGLEDSAVLPDGSVGRVLGAAQVTLDDLEVQAGVQAMAAPSLGDGLASFRKTQSGSFDVAATASRYLWMTFEVTNTSPKALSNLTVIAYAQQANNIAGTAFKNIKNAAGGTITAASVAQGIAPTQRTQQVGAQLQVQNSNADLQGITAAEANDLEGQALARGLLKPDDKLLEYGFVARTDTGRSIAVGGKGRVTMAFKIPISSDATQTPKCFTLTMLLADISTRRVTRSNAETTANAISRAPSGTTELALIGTNDTVTGFSKIHLPSIKTAFNPALEPSRDAWLLPFNRASIWNMPLGRDAQITDVGTIVEPLNGFGADTELFFKFKASDPLRPLYDPEEFGVVPGPPLKSRCTGTTQEGGPFSMRVPDDLIVPDATLVPYSTPNNVAILLQPDRSEERRVGKEC